MTDKQAQLRGGESQELSPELAGQLRQILDNMEADQSLVPVLEDMVALCRENGVQAEQLIRFLQTDDDIRFILAEQAGKAIKDGVECAKEEVSGFRQVTSRPERGAEVILENAKGFIPTMADPTKTLDVFVFCETVEAVHGGHDIGSIEGALLQSGDLKAMMVTGLREVVIPGLVRKKYTEGQEQTREDLRTYLAVMYPEESMTATFSHLAEAAIHGQIKKPQDLVKFIRFLAHDEEIQRLLRHHFATAIQKGVKGSIESAFEKDLTIYGEDELRAAIMARMLELTKRDLGYREQGRKEQGKTMYLLLADELDIHLPLIKAQEVLSSDLVREIVEYIDNVVIPDCVFQVYLGAHPELSQDRTVKSEVQRLLREDLCKISEVVLSTDPSFPDLQTVDSLDSRTLSCGADFASMERRTSLGVNDEDMGELLKSKEMLYQFMGVFRRVIDARIKNITLAVMPSSSVTLEQMLPGIQASLKAVNIETNLKRYNPLQAINQTQPLCGSQQDLKKLKTLLIGGDEAFARFKEGGETDDQGVIFLRTLCEGLLKEMRENFNRVDAITAEIYSELGVVALDGGGLEDLRLPMSPMIGSKKELRPEVLQAVLEVQGIEDLSAQIRTAIGAAIKAWKGREKAMAKKRSIGNGGSRNGGSQGINGRKEGPPKKTSRGKGKHTIAERRREKEK